MLKIIRKDRHILVIEKPAGMPSVDVSGGNVNTVAKWILGNFPKQSKLKVSPEEAGLIHRLDNDTSGIIIAARTDRDYETLRGIWNSKEVLKEYLCLVLGQTEACGKITKLIAHHPDKSNKMIVVEDAAGAKELKGLSKNVIPAKAGIQNLLKSLDPRLRGDDKKVFIDNPLKARFAETEYELVENFLDYSYLKVRITGGVRHQIRCHLASIGHPVAGDRLYQRTKHASRDWLCLTRHFLHASKAGFPHPASNKYIEFESELPEDLRILLKGIRN